jgi:hypothetical protein
MTAPSSSTGRTFRLPVWAIAAMLVAGLLSVAFAGGSFFTFVALVLLVVNVVGSLKYFGDEVRRISAAHVGHGPVDRGALRKDAMGSLVTPMWLVITLAVGSVWTGIALVKFVGFLVGLIFILAVLVALGAALYFGYRAAKKRGYLS